MLTVSDMPHVLAVINAATIGVLIHGYLRIRAGDRDVHRRTMIAAGGLGIAFLAIYFYYHASAGLAKFGGEGAIRGVYFSLLAVHVLMAAVAALLAPMAVILALKKRFAGHRRIARWALPIWLFVSVSGLVVYAMAVHAYPYGGV